MPGKLPAKSILSTTAGKVAGGIARNAEPRQEPARHDEQLPNVGARTAGDRQITA